MPLGGTAPHQPLKRSRAGQLATRPLDYDVSSAALPATCPDHDLQTVCSGLKPGHMISVPAKKLLSVWHSLSNVLLPVCMALGYSQLEKSVMAGSIPCAAPKTTRGVLVLQLPEHE